MSKVVDFAELVRTLLVGPEGDTIEDVMNRSINDAAAAAIDDGAESTITLRLSLKSRDGRGVAIGARIQPRKSPPSPISGYAKMVQDEDGKLVRDERKV